MSIPVELPAGLYLVATPLGNLGDMSSRGIETLSSVDVIACEDTREMKKLLLLLEIETQAHIISVREQNERDQAGNIIELVASGKSVAYASDAGMPAISDPGSVLVDHALDAGVLVTCAPGATAVTTAVAVSGFTETSFAFLGFFPRDTKMRTQTINDLSYRPYTTVFYESPKRLHATLEALHELGDRRLVVCRELTKKFEEIKRGTSVDLSEHFSGEIKGECVIVVEGTPDSGDDSRDLDKVRQACVVLVAQHVSQKDAIEIIGTLSDIPKNTVKKIYEESK